VFQLPGSQELLFLILLAALLSVTGLWPQIRRILRELRGESGEEMGRASSSDLELCYKLLGVSPSASWKEIEAAYRRKAKIHHPDHGGDEDAMRSLNDAYAAIKESKRRA